MKARLSLALALAASASVSFAATLTVDGIGAGANEYATIQEAFDAAAVSGDEIVINSGSYSEFLELKGKSVTVRGANPNNRPVIELIAGIETLTNVTLDYGFGIEGDGVTVNIQDLIFVPGATLAAEPNTPKGIYSSAITADANIEINFSNILLAPNNGSGAPLITDPFDTVTDISTGQWPHDGFYIMSRAFGGAVDSNGTYTFDNIVVIGAGRDAIVCYSEGSASTGFANSQSFTNIITSRSDRRAGQLGDRGTSASGGSLLITGSLSNPGWVSISDTDGINIFGATNATLNYIVSLDSASEGVEMAADNVDSITANNILVVNSASDGFVWTNQSGLNSNDHVLSDSTFVNCGSITATNTGGIWPADTTTNSYTVNNSIFVGGADQGGLALGATQAAITTLNNNAFSPAPFVATFGTGAGTETNNNPIVEDPAFGSTTIGSIDDIADAFKPTNSNFATAGTGGTALGGFGGFDSAVSEWVILD